MEIIDPDQLQQLLYQHGLSDWGQHLPDIVMQHLDHNLHGDMKKWQSALHALPDIAADTINFTSDAVSITTDIDHDLQSQIKTSLQTLHPWRKGPFDIHGIYIDTEWRSYLKWNRLISHIEPLKDRRVLDIGCGNGYYLWRMLGEGVQCAIGIDPTQLFAMQFQAVRHFAGKDHPITVLPIGIEHLPLGGKAFDTVFSMGVIYHRRDPNEHIDQLKSLLRPGGELVLETLVINADHAVVLHPEDRYAQMRNVWNIPSPAKLLEWFKDCGMSDARIVDVTATTTNEQRSTEWMYFQSLSDFLDPDNPGHTVEGYPAPVRAIAIAHT
ncbi:MAG: tRNA 5-methoxyuridine(34)/uridine 5-oxyacetic acid(34) synthase CmoB [Gammaproteobacteria bacterium]|nr:MAG: tRNA 5-methoxyuridine(34)/uridine 5-oxyacetic acid(34) synthase CmoB [Gammaproteobacteria bacterium]